jgi:hypothetical protein
MIIKGRSKRLYLFVHPQETFATSRISAGLRRGEFCFRTFQTFSLSSKEHVADWPAARSWARITGHARRFDSFAVSLAILSTSSAVVLSQVLNWGCDICDIRRFRLWLGVWRAFPGFGPL